MPDSGESRIVRTFTAILAMSIPLLSIAWAMNVQQALGLAFFNEQVIAVFLGLSLALVYLTKPLRRTVGFFDLAAALLSLIATGYVALRYGDLLERMWMRPVDVVVTGSAILVLTVEAIRRAAGWAMTILVLVALAFALVGHFVPGELQGMQVAPSRLAVFLALDTNALLGMALLIAATVVVSFVIFGNFLNAAGGGAFFTDLAMAAMGRSRGGPAKVAVVASMLFGSVSGSAVANVVATGVITIPMMKRGGYRGQQAGAIEAVASTGGQLMPPVMGAAAFLMAEILQISYASIALAALVPAILYYAALFFQVDLTAARGNLRVPAGERLPQLGAVMASGWPFLLPFVVLVYALFVLNARPEYAAVVATASVLVIGFWRHWRGTGGFSPRAIPELLREAGLSVVDILMIGAAAGIIIGVMNISALGFAMTMALVGLGTGSLPALLAIAALTSIVLGMGMPTLGVYLLLATLIAPALVEVGITPMAAHLFVLYFGMLSMITPPVAIAAFAAATIAGAPPMRTGWEAAVFGWSAFVIPFLFVLSPPLLLIGTWAEIAYVAAVSLVGIWLITAAIVGYALRSASLIQRGTLAVAGILLLLPHDAGGNLWPDLVGIALAAMGLAWNRAAPVLPAPQSNGDPV
jgi:TRAP transporter 4TM/12TM fusion protein